MTSDNSGLDQLKDSGRELMGNLGHKALGTVNDKLSGVTDKLTDIGGGGPIGKAVGKAGEAKAKGDSPVAGGLKGAVSGIKDKVTGGGSGGGGGGGGKATKSTNIIESIDVGVPLSVAYNQWTEFGEFPSFMKKVENVEAQEDTKLTFKAQIFLSHRTWEATILEQVPDERIVWRSKGEKGHVDGSVTFHELAPNLTRILVVLEYYPQGLFEKTGNLWRAQGRRARAELRHFRRHVMTRTILEPDEVEGWRGVIEDGEVVETHEEHVEQEEAEQSQEEGDDAEADDSGEGDEDEYESEDEDALDGEDEDEEPEDEEEESAGDEDEYEEPEDEEDEEPAEDEDEYEEPAEDEDEEPADEEEEPVEDEDEYEEPVEDEDEDEYEEPAEDEEEEPDEEEVKPRRRRRAS
jgi:hypothetical protein